MPVDLRRCRGARPPALPAAPIVRSPSRATAASRRKVGGRRHVAARCCVPERGVHVVELHREPGRRIVFLRARYECAERRDVLRRVLGRVGREIAVSIAGSTRMAANVCGCSLQQPEASSGPARRGRTRDSSTSCASRSAVMSMSWSATLAAAARSNGPRNALSTSRSSRSPSSSNRNDQFDPGRRARCGARAGRFGSGRIPTNPHRAGRASARPRTRGARVAASSSASGMPSRRRHSPATVSMSSTTAAACPARVAEQPYDIRLRRCASTGAEGSGSPSGATTRTSSPATPSPSRPVQDAHVGCLSDHARCLGRGVENLLAVVDDEEKRAGLERLDETIAVGDAVARRYAERVEERPRDRGRFDPRRLKSTNQHSRSTWRRELDREPRLADPAGPRERHEPRARDARRSSRRRSSSRPRNASAGSGMFVATTDDRDSAAGSALRSRVAPRRSRGTGSRARARCR